MTTSQHLAVLSDIQGLLTRNYSDTRQFLRHVLAKANTLIGSNAGFIGLVQSNGRRHVVTVWDRFQQLVGAAHGRFDTYVRDLPIGGRDLPKKDRSCTGYVALHKRPRRISDVSHETFYRPDRRDTRSELGVPILFDGNVLGVINLQSRVPNFYTREHQAILTLVARLIAPTLDRMMAREGFGRELSDLLTSLNRELEALPAGVPPGRHSFDSVVGAIAAALSSRTCRIWLIDGSDPGRLVLRGSCGAAARQRFRPQREADPAWHAIRRRTSVRLGAGDVFLPGSGPNGLGRTDRLSRPLIVAPILRAGRPAGIIELTGKTRTRDNPQGAYSSADVQTLQIVQGQIALALEHLAYREQALEQARRLSELSELSHIFAELDLRKTLEAILARIPKLCAARGCSIFLWDEQSQTFVLRATHGLPSEQVGRAAYLPGQGLTGWVGLHGKSLKLRNRTRAELARVAPDLFWEGKYEDAPGNPDLEHAPFIAVPIFLRGRTAGVIRISDRTLPGPFTDADLDLLTAVASHVAAPIAHRERTDDRLRLLETLRKLLHSLDDRFAAIKRGHDDRPVKSIIDVALDDARQALGADIVTLYPYDADRDVFHTPPLRAGDIRHPEFMDHGLQRQDAPWRVLREGPRFWRNVRQLRAFSGPAPARSDLPARARFPVREGIVSTAALRLDVGGTTVGVLFVNYRSPHAFDTPQREMIETFAGHLALAMELAFLYRRMRHLASVEERDFLGQDLHDVLSVLTWGGLTRVDSALANLRKGNLEALEADLRVVRGAVDHAKTDVSNLVGMLKKSPIDDSGLVPALRQLNELLWKTQGLEVTLPAKEPTLPKWVKRHLYRVIEHAVVNAGLHGHARAVAVKLSSGRRRARVQVRDDGIGFNVRDALQKPFHFGLRGIQQRVHSLGGSVTIRSKPAHGTTLTVEIPLKETLYAGLEDQS